MDLTLISLITLAVFFVGIGVAHRFSPERTSSTPPTIGLFTIAAALFAVIGAGEYSISLAQIREYGWAGLSFIAGLAAAFLLISIFTKQIFSIRETAISYSLDGYINFTTPDFLNALYGRSASSVATAIVAFCFFGIYVLQVYVGGLLLSAASGISVMTASSLIAITVVAYAVAGGFYSIFRTDLVQATLMHLSLLIVIIGSVIVHLDTTSFATSFTELNELAFYSISPSALTSDPTVVSIFILTICAAFAGADLWQRVNIASTPKSATAALRQGALSLLVFGVLIYAFAVDAIAVLDQASISSTDPFADYIKIVTTGETVIPAWPPFLVAVFSIGLLAAFVSTADTCLLLTVSSIQNEFHRWSGLGASQASAKNQELNPKFTHSLLIIIGLVGLGVSLFTPNVVDQFLIVLGALAVLGIPVFASLLGFGTKGLVSFSMILGFAATIYIGYIDPSLNAGLGILIPCAPGILCFATRRNIRPTSE